MKLMLDAVLQRVNGVQPIPDAQGLNYVNDCERGLDAALSIFYYLHYSKDLASITTRGRLCLV
jgi:hypothetical protein